MLTFYLLGMYNRTNERVVFFMFCPYCNQSIPDNAKFCSCCGSIISPDPVPAESKKFKFFKGPSDGGKSYAAIMTALMVFPATLSIALDMIFHHSDGWSTYVVATVIVGWIVTVFPALRITPAPVSALICLFSILAYVAFLVGKRIEASWFYQVGLPLFIVAAIFISIDAALLGSGKIKGLHFMSLLSVEVALYFVASEIAVDIFKFGTITLGWSAILCCFCISAVALYEAVSYSVSLRKKKRKNYYENNK